MIFDELKVQADSKYVADVIAAKIRSLRPDRYLNFINMHEEDFPIIVNIRSCSSINQTGWDKLENSSANISLSDFLSFDEGKSLKTSHYFLVLDGCLKLKYNSHEEALAYCKSKTGDFEIKEKILTEEVLNDKSK